MRGGDAVGLVQTVHNSGSPKAVAGVQLTVPRQVRSYVTPQPTTPTEKLIEDYES